mmetsp:Transcript_12764/g.38000  ORF Transcript_12764/g.38000 Transcript_12764/m.38000 type:complete len:269 (-) Transcript_12764:30-836(-)
MRLLALAALAAAAPPPLEWRAALRESPPDALLTLRDDACTADEGALRSARAAAAAEGLDAVGFHGTTTVAFRYDGGTCCCVDSRASLGSFVGQPAEKIIPISKRALGTMAGSAADCTAWLRAVSAYSKLRELETGAPLTAREAARTLAHALRREPGEHGVGTMVFDADSLYYVDGDGLQLAGDAFAVGSGSPFAYPALEAGLAAADAPMGPEAAAAVAERAVETAAVRDAFSGGFTNCCVAEKATGAWRRVARRQSPERLEDRRADAD